MQVDGSADKVEMLEGEPDASIQAVAWPSAVEILLQRPDFHPDARAALARLQQADIDKIWAISQEEVTSWPELMRSEHDVAACFIGWAMSWWQDTPDGHELHGVARIEGVGVRTRQKNFENGRWEYNYSGYGTERVARKAAQRAMRQALGPAVYRHLPYCVPELLHVDVSFDSLGKEKVDKWIERRAKKVAATQERLFRARCLSDPRSLGALQAHYNGIGVIRRLGGEVDLDPVNGERLLALLQRAPVAWEAIRSGGIWEDRREKRDMASRLDRAEALIERWGSQLKKHHGVPLHNFQVAGKGSVERDLRIRAAVIAQGTNLVNAGTTKGWGNLCRFLEAWIAIPGAAELVMQPGFTIGPLFAGMNDCESERLVRLTNSLRDCVRWIGCSKEPGWAQALLAMNVRELFRLSHDTHVRMNELFLRQEQRAAAREAEPAQEVRPLLGEAQEGAFRIVELMTPGELKREGETLAHCVGTYWGEVAQRMCKILSVQDSDGTRLATCKLTKRHGRYRVAELAGHKNGSPPPGVMAAVDALVGKINTGALPADANALAEYRIQPEERRRRLGVPKLGHTWIDARLAPWVGRTPVVIRRTKASPPGASG